MALFHGSLIQALDTNGDPINAAIWKFYLTGGTAPAPVYSDFDFGTSLGATVTANSAGRFVPIYLDDDVTYRAVLCNAAGTPISPYDIDPVQGDAAILASLAASGGSATVGYINSPAGSVATTVQTALRRTLWLDDFGAVGDGTTDNKAAFDLFRAAVATIQGVDPDAWVTLNLTYGKTYASRDNGWLHGLDKVIVNGNGAHFINICTAGQSSADFDHFAIVIGAQAYLDLVTTMMAGKGFATNHNSHYLINAATRGATTVTTTTLADAGNFTAGDWGLITSDLAYLGGQPPSFHFFEYTKVLTAVAGTGVITPDEHTLRNNYSATRDNTLLSGQMSSRARILKVVPQWDCDLIVRDLIVEPAANFPTFPAYCFGRNVKLENCQMPGIVATTCDSFRASNCQFPTASNQEPVDKLVARYSYENCQFTGGGQCGGDGSGGTGTFKNCSFDGDVRTLRNVHYDSCTFGGAITTFKSNNLRFTNCSGPGGILYTEEAAVMTVDGATITCTAKTIVIPRASIVSGTGLGILYESLVVGARLDEVSDTTVNAYRNGKFAIVTSITDSGANVVLGVNYSGGVLIANGTVFRAPCLLSYHGSGNFGTGMIADDVNPQSTGGIPNGGLDVIRGNMRRFLIAPSDGAGYDLDTLPANGMPKRVWARVHRAYTGVTHPTLGLECLGVQPTAAQYWRVDLKTTGVRESSRSAATAALGADTWAALPATYTGRYRLVINATAGGAAATLAESFELLPVLELLVEFEDVAHDVPVAA